ncbi:uncharacterized protein LOC135710252 [Ochlerotatus camptorhynchus]|uniref:uncharacterized protein LOC135710252 n=1 Tax=Ochlerotatus camptorhynchus TaxID=644619 RepID=UPI0031DC096C
MAQASRFRFFDGETEEWELYKEQLEQFFTANQIADNMKKAVLINHCEAKTYKLLRDLCTPNAPAEKTYVQLCELMSKHFTPPVVVHKERRNFMSARMRDDPPESLNAWAARVKILESNCKLGDQLQHDLLNKFVDGLEGKAYDRICEEDEKLTFERAYEIAIKYEPEESKSAGIIQMGRGKHDFERGRSSGVKNSTGVGDNRCLACNRVGHFKRDCRFKEYICRKCNKRGHLQSACTSKRNYFVGGQEQLEHSLGDTDELNLEQNFISKCDGSIFSIEGQVFDVPLETEVRISSRAYRMQLDTGAAVSVISVWYFNKNMSACELKSTNLRLTGYGGEQLLVKGVIEPVIEFRGIRKALRVR